MFKITIASLGKVKEKYFQAALTEYEKRLRPYAKVEFVELKPEPFGGSNKAAAKKIEGERVENFLGKRAGAEIFLLHEGGEELTSQGLAKKIEKFEAREIIFVIGGALGWEEKLLQKYPLLSLSRLTFLHEMAKVILLEQIYRSITILKGKSYHY